MERQRDELQNITWKSDRNKIYLNWCGAERIRKDVPLIEDRYRDWQHRYEDDPKGSIRTLRAAIEGSRASLAELLGCANPRHIVFTTGSEESLKNVLFCHQLIPYGSRLLATDCEFFGIYRKIAAPRYQTDIARIWSKRNKNEIVSEIVHSVCDETRLLLVSHVCYNSGVVLPIRDICAEVKKKNPKVRVLVDGAQAVGQIPVSVDELGCDFYAGDAHKWLVGPDQTGFLYVRENEHLEIIAKDICSAFAVFPELNHDKGSRSGAIAFALAALAEALTPFLNGGILREVQESNRILAGRFRDGISREAGVYYSVAPKYDAALASSIVAITFANQDNPRALLKVIYDELLNEGIHCALMHNAPSDYASRINIPPLLRFCFHYWNTDEEITTVIRQLKKIAEKHLVKPGGVT